jgi:D-aminopeptidase
MRASLTSAALLCVALGAAVMFGGDVQAQPGGTERPRARDLGIAPGSLRPGPLNAITDVPGVRVGHATIVAGTSVRTGVTAILPHGGNLFREKVPAAVHVFNAFGKLVGATQVEELGQLETPILLTNTLSVWDAAAALAEWMLAQPANEDVRSINPVVGETNDGTLNDIRGRHVKAGHVRAALTAALSERGTGSVEEGSVGAGTGTIAFGWKGGIGTSSRRAPSHVGAGSEFTIGVLVQTNFGGALMIAGVPVWKHLTPPTRRDEARGSCMMIVATDAPLDARQLQRLAARAIHGMARAGSTGSHGSGDYVIAFSTRNRYTPLDSPRSVRQIEVLREDDLSPLFEAVVDATEEAIYNSLLRATSVLGRDGNVAEALPIDKLRDLLKAQRRE